MKTKVLIPFLTFFLFFSLATKAQVTIGSENDPAEGALLDLKQNADGSSTKGLMYPRVALTSKTALTPMTGTPSAHAGLVVYNTTASGDFTPGLHIWSGTEWMRLVANSIVAPSIEELKGQSATMSPTVVFKPTTGFYSGILSIPYAEGNGGFYAASDIVITSANFKGLTLTPYAGQLSYGPGVIYIKVEGTPTVATDGESVVIDVTFLGKSTTATLGEDAVERSIIYRRKTVPIPTGTPGTATPVDASTVEIGNLKVRYVYAGTNGRDSYIQFSPKIPTHASYWFEKMGAGVGVPGSGTGTYLYTYGLVPNLVVNSWYDFESGVAGDVSRTNVNVHKDLNPTTRDQGRATISFQNNDSREMYRVTCNSYTSIDANTPGAVTLFVEWLE